MQILVSTRIGESERDYTISKVCFADQAMKRSEKRHPIANNKINGKNKFMQKLDNEMDLGGPLKQMMHTWECKNRTSCGLM